MDAVAICARERDSAGFFRDGGIAGALRARHLFGPLARRFRCCQLRRCGKQPKVVFMTERPSTDCVRRRGGACGLGGRNAAYEDLVS